MKCKQWYFRMSNAYPIQHTLINILKCCLVFYGVYFAVGSLLFGIYRLQSFDGRIPFNFKTWVDLTNCCMNYSSEQIVNVVAMEVTYSVAGLAFGGLVLHRVWDYAVTVTVIHIAISCLIMLDFAVNWSWWVCLGVGVLLMISLGEAVAYGRRICRGKVKVQPANDTKEPKSYLQIH